MGTRILPVGTDDGTDDMQFIIQETRSSLTVDGEPVEIVDDAVNNIVTRAEINSRVAGLQGQIAFYQDAIKFPKDP